MTRTGFWTRWAACALGVFCAAQVAGKTDTSAFTIADVPEMDRIVTETRAEFLKRKKFDRLDATILVLQEDGTWHRGSHNPDVTAYPASCVKLAYMAAAMNWCRENGKPYDYLDHAVRPMVAISDNVQTGVVVDAITETTNLTDVTTSTDPRFGPWMAKRRYTERFLESRGLLGNQVIIHKTYPTNSGRMPEAAEKVAREVYGMNVMQPRLSASLVLEVVKGAIEPGATEYMRELLVHRRWGSGSQIGHGLPPGTVYLNKTGVAYDTCEDFAYFQLPNGREIVMAAFTNGWDRSQRSPHDANHLGVFAEMLVERLGLLEGCPTRLVLDVASTTVTLEGEWTSPVDSVMAYGGTFRETMGEGAHSAAWEFDLPEDGVYELAAWHPEATHRSSSAVFLVSDERGLTSGVLSQRGGGARWVHVGDYRLKAGRQEVRLSDMLSTPGESLAVSALKVTKWPDERILPAPRVTVRRGTTRGGQTTWTAEAIVRDAAGEPVNRARVTGQFSGGTMPVVSALTDKSGKAVLEVPLPSSGGTPRFTVASVTAEPYVYLPPEVRPLRLPQPGAAEEGGP